MIWNVSNAEVARWNSISINGWVEIQCYLRNWGCLCTVSWHNWPKFAQVKYIYALISFRTQKIIFCNIISWRNVVGICRVRNALPWVCASLIFPLTVWESAVMAIIPITMVERIFEFTVIDRIKSWSPTTKTIYTCDRHKCGNNVC